MSGVSAEFISSSVVDFDVPHHFELNRGFKEIALTDKVCTLSEWRHNYRSDLPIPLLAKARRCVR